MKESKYILISMHPGRSDSEDTSGRWQDGFKLKLFTWNLLEKNPVLLEFILWSLVSFLRHSF